VSYEEASDYALSINATYFELSAESGRNCEAVYRQIVEKIIDSKYAYMEKIHSDIKTFIWHDTKQFMVMGVLYMILVEIASIYFCLLYYLIWNLTLESFYGFCDDKQPAYVLIPFFFALIISLAILFPLMVVKTKKLVFIYGAFMMVLALVCTGLLFYFTK
jgi:hypothetical protein